MKTVSVQLFRTPALANWRKIAIALKIRANRRRKLALTLISTVTQFQ